MEMQRTELRPRRVGQTTAFIYTISPYLITEGFIYVATSNPDVVQMERYKAMFLDLMQLHVEYEETYVTRLKMDLHQNLDEMEPHGHSFRNEKWFTGYKIILNHEETGNNQNT